MPRSLRTESDVLLTTTTEADTDSLTESDSLGGVTTTESQTTTQTTTENDTQRPTYTDTHTATSSLTTSAGAVTGGGGDDSLQETSTDTHSSLITVTGVSTGITTTSSNLGGVIAATTESVTESSRVGGVTATDYSTTTDTLTGSSSDNGTVTSAETRTATTTLGSGGIITGGGNYDSSSMGSADSHSLYEVDAVTAYESDTVSSTVGGVTTSHTIYGVSSDTPTSTLAGNSTESEIMTDTAALGSGGVISTGGDSLWDTVTDSGNQTLYSTGGDLVTVTASVSSALAGVTLSDQPNSTETDLTNLAQSGPYRETDTESSNDTWGAGGAITAGADIQTAWNVGTLTVTQNGSSTITTTEAVTESSSLGSVTATDSTTSTDTLSGTSGDTSTATSTETQTATATMGAGGVVTSGNDYDSLYETGVDSSSATATDYATTTEKGSSTFSDSEGTTTETFHSTGNPNQTLTSAAGSTSSSTGTDTVTLGTSATITGGTLGDTVYQTGWNTGTLTGVSTQTETDISTETYSVSQTSVTTVSETASDSVTAASNGSTDTLIEAGTITDNWNLLEPSTVTTTDAETITEGTSDIVSSGTAGDSLYETGSTGQTDSINDVLTSTLISTVGQSNTGDGSQDATTTTSTLTDSSRETSGGPTTLTQNETMALGSNDAIAGGTLTSTFWSNGTDSYSLYETGNETYSSTDTVTQAGALALAENLGYAGSETPTVTSTQTSTFSSTQAVTTTMGSNAAVTSGTEGDSLYETGSDSTTSAGAGTNVRQYAFSGGASDSSTYTTTFSVSGTDSGGFTETESDAPVYGGNDVITGGSSVETLTSTDSTTQTYTENGARTVSWGAGNFDEGSYSATETTTLSDSQYDSSSFGLGINGTIASGTAISSTTTSYSDSESDLETGSEFVSDPAGGPDLGGTYSQTSITTSFAYSVDRGAPTFGAGGVISGGGNSFTFLQNSSDSHNLNITTTSDVVTDSGYDTYSESMSGTETYGPGGTVSGGSDSFTWAQTASDNLILTQDYGGTTLGIYTLYDMTVDDQIYQNFSDVGNDILGPSDSILGGGDTFTWGSSRDLVSTITDYGQAATPYLILAYSSDQTGLNQTGSDTLTTNGHIYSTVTYTYNEQTSDNDSVSQSVSGTGWVREGSASDSYSDSDSGTITVSDTTTSSFDSFTVSDNHSISGGIAATATYSPGNAGWTDKGVDQNQLYASGTKSTTGDVYTFTDTESSTDNFVLNKTIPSSMNGVATDSTSDGSSMTGATSTGPSGSTFGYTETSQSTSQFDDGGNVTSGLVVTPITLSTTTSLALQIVLTGPIAATTTTTVGSSTTLTGGNDGANFTETDYAGEGSTAGTPVAALAGSSPDGSAEHQGTSPGGLDTSSGLLSALGGEGVHAMSFAGAEILPTANPTGTAFWLEESNQSGQTPTNWVSHPSGIGYSRGSSGIITSGSGSGSGSHSSTTGPPIAGNAPTMDSGTSDGGAGQELGRLGNFNAGGNENSNATQPGATPRAQQVSMLMLPAGSPAATNISNFDDDGYLHFDDPVLEFIANNPLYDLFLGPTKPPSSPNGGNASRSNGNQQSASNGSGQRAMSSMGSGSSRSASSSPMVYGPLDSLLDQGAAAVQQAKDFLTDQALGVIGALDNADRAAGSPVEKATNAVDGFAAGIGNQVSNGGTNRAREAAYGETATNNQQGIIYQAGQVVGFVINVVLTFVNPCKAAANVGTAIRVLNAIQGAASAADAVDSYNKGDYAGAALNGLSALMEIFGGGCFAAGTPILTPEGSKLIEAIQPGDWVMTAPDDDPEAAPVPRRVQMIFENYLPTLDLYINGRTIRTTAEHPFWVRDRGWVAAHQLEAGDQLRAH